MPYFDTEEKKKSLKKFMDAYIIFEQATYGVDPRETLEGTHMDINEGFKKAIGEKYAKLLSTGGPYYDKAVESFGDKDSNLVDWRNADDLRKLSGEARDNAEEALAIFYEGDDDEASFDLVKDVAGNNYDLTGYLYYLKDCSKYLPIRSKMFDDRFKILGIDTSFDGHCSWENYTEYLGLIADIQEQLVQYINSDITLLDAHSFVWWIGDISMYLDYLDNDSIIGKLVNNDKHGQGKVTELEEDPNYGQLLVVEYKKETIKYPYPNALKSGDITVIGVEKWEEPLNNKKIVVEEKESACHTYLVFQGGEYEEEYLSGYLWAPYKDRGGNSPFHWELLTELEPGDTVYHYRNGYIRAISKVTDTWKDSIRPEAFGVDYELEKRGRRVACDPKTLEEPIFVEEYIDTILKYRNEKYSAFNKNGGANQGYLFELEPEIAKAFDEAAEGFNAGLLPAQETEKYASWEVSNRNWVTKECGKAFFNNNGSHLPVEVRPFFEAENLTNGEKVEIALLHESTIYDARVEMEKHPLSRTRIFWSPDLGRIFDEEKEKYTKYPKCYFQKVNREYWPDGREWPDKPFYVVALLENEDGEEIPPSVELTNEKIETAEFLLKCIKGGKRTIYYKDITDAVSTHPHWRTKVPGIIGDLSIYCEQLGLPHISAMVINKDTGLPGPGFKQMCVEWFGYDDSKDITEVLESELDQIQNCKNWQKLADKLGIKFDAHKIDVIKDEEEEVQLPDVNADGFTVTFETDGKKASKPKEYSGTKKVGKHVDYESLNRKKKNKGTAGELIVLNAEIDKLEGTELKPIHSADIEGDGLGYDITSYELDGTEIYIEVKTTSDDTIDGFFLSENERQAAELLGDKYKIYRVYNYNSKKKTANIIIYEGPFGEEAFELKPTAYKVYLK